MPNLMVVESIAAKIFKVRCKKVMFNSDLARLYGVTTKRLNEQVRRNIKRFPIDFMFQLTREEFDSLRSQNASLKDGAEIVSKRGKHSKYLPFVFTEQGVAMLSSVLKSDRAIQVNILIMRAFVRLKEALVNYDKLVLKIDGLEKKYSGHDEKIRVIFEAIKQLLAPPEAKERRITGFAEK